MSSDVSPNASSSSSSSHPICSEPVDLAVKSFFGLSHLRGYQKEAIDHIFNGRDCLVVQATGAGKSMCFQLPPVVSKKTAIVVSPLLSLMQDQVMSLNKKGIHADYLGCTQTNKSVCTNAANGLYDVLFLTPEKAMSLKESFWEKIYTNGVCLFAVDEAHCISEWGPDFRQDYKTLHELREKLPGVPFVALTATATDRVREDIINSLKLSEPFVSIGSFDRPNIFYSVTLIKGPPRVKSFLDLIKTEVQKRFHAHESTIIYCLTIRDTQEVYEYLTALGVSCAMYHGQMDRFLREQAHKHFVSDSVLVMVATIAFGMGIDKPNVRCVIHYGCPKSLESYYQESGRCGRDGLPSCAFLYYNKADFCRGDYYCADVQSATQKQAILTSFLAAQKYCMIASCRRRDLLNYFGEDSTAKCGNCDNCSMEQPVQMELSQEAVLLLKSIKECGGRWGLNMPINVLRGSKCKKIIECDYQQLSVYGKGKARSSQWWKSLASILTSHGFIADSTAGGFRTVSVTKNGEKLIIDSDSSQSPLFFAIPHEMIEEETKCSNDDECNEKEDVPLALVPIETSKVECNDHVPQQSNHMELSSNDEVQLYQMLLEVRSRLAEEISVPPFDICDDELLINIARARPSNNGSLCLLNGVTKVFLDSFAVIFLHHVKEMCEENNISFDNFDSDLIDALNEDFVNTTDEDSMTYDATMQKVINVVSSSAGVSLEEILAAFPNNLKDRVLSVVEDLLSSLQIFTASGLYYK